MQNEIGICKGCGKKEPIVNRTHWLGENCNRSRLDGQKGVKIIDPPPAKGKMTDAIFYKIIWNMRPHICIECKLVLNDFSATYISHIVSKGSHSNLRFNLDNVQVLCASCHRRYETGDREGMRTAKATKEIYDRLKTLSNNKTDKPMPCNNAK